jgi:outer membrane protein assembly factor BamA
MIGARLLACSGLLIAFSSSRPSSATDPKGAREAKTEFTPVPIVGGNSDIGFGGGALASIARIVPERDPYLYRFEVATSTTVKGQNGDVIVPFHDDYLLASFPHLVPNRVRLDARVSYTYEATQKYYGIGNATPVPDDRSLDDPLYEYNRGHATASAKGTLRLWGPISVLLWIAYTQNWMNVPPETKLAMDATSGSPTVRSLIPTLDSHGVVAFTYGLEFDTRNDKVSPIRGAHHATRIDVAPGGISAIPHRFGRWNTHLRMYVPLWTEDATLAFRFVSDLLFGDPPFYELARIDDSSALGGPKGLRGVPASRYTGMMKFLAGVELRQTLFSFRFLSKDNRLGAAAFADTGRVFATYSSEPELDGTSLGLKVGLGAGLRLLAGQSFVLRADAAWSPDARPIGFYLNAGQAF